ncbi:MAG: hypothetical protein ABI972_24785 [Acidobacteriota bacterium]
MKICQFKTLQSHSRSLNLHPRAGTVAVKVHFQSQTKVQSILLLGTAAAVAAAQNDASLHAAAQLAFHPYATIKASSATPDEAPAAITEARGGTLRKVTHTESWTGRGNSIFVFYSPVT